MEINFISRALQLPVYAIKHNLFDRLLLLFLDRLAVAKNLCYVAVSPVPARVPSQCTFAPTVMSVTSVG